MDARHSLGEPRVLISRRALLHNATVLRRCLPREVRLCAVVKADAYGHGAAIVADTLCNFCDDISDRPPADALAVASMDEAAGLGPVQVPIIVFRPLENAFVGRQRARIEEAIRRGWVLTVCSAAAAEDLARIATAAGRCASVQVLIDTGMTRSGVAPRALDDLLHRIDARPSLQLTGLCTHFASSEDVSGNFTTEQLSLFDRATTRYSSHAGGAVTRHAANSAAVFFHPDSHLDMVRPGIALYGIDPSGAPHMDRLLRPVMKWTAPVVGISEIPPGGTVGYCQNWTARRRTRVGLLPVGYADGYPRSFSNRAIVMLHGRPVRVIGNVSMDLTTIDLTDLPEAMIGEEAILMDNDPLSPASVYALARWAETIPYEILSRIGPRVKRVPVDPEDLVVQQSELPDPFPERVPWATDEH